MAGVAVSGLASGLDTNSIVAKLMAVESAPLTRLQLTEQNNVSIQTQLRDVQTQVKALHAAATKLASASNWVPAQTVESSTPATAAARVVGTPGSGAYAVTVLGLAQSEQRSYDVTSGLPASITVTSSSDPAKTITVSLAVGASAQDAADAINAAAGSPVSAAVVAPGDGTTRLVLTSRSSGAAGGFSSGLGGQVAVRAGADAQVQIAGDPVVFSSPTNVMTNAVPGVELTLKATGTTTITASAPDADQDVVVAAVKAFVDAYNSVVTTIRAKVNETTVPNAQTDSDKRKGLLHADTGLTSLLTQLRQAVSNPVTGSGTLRAFADLGVSTGATTGSAALSGDSVAGLLTFDETALRDALDSDPAQVRAVLGATAGTPGVSQALGAVLTPQTQSGGLLGQRVGRLDTVLSSIRDDEAAMQRHLDATQQRLQSQFAVMEAALSSSQSMAQWLSGQISSLG
ncbi:MAG TPA: flagellar filament capping protein FliD [Solirubrobacteraceae bacterium]|nr:flagellar filament capping protein FliD [Solirubrobacteraceae bacterium]